MWFMFLKPESLIIWLWDLPLEEEFEELFAAEPEVELALLLELETLDGIFGFELRKVNGRGW